MTKLGLRFEQINAKQALRRRGDPRPLARLVREGVPLDEETRELAARIIEGERPKKPKGRKITSMQMIERTLMYRDLKRFKRTFQAIHGKECPHYSDRGGRKGALERVAARWEIDPDELERIYRNPGRYGI